MIIKEPNVTIVSGGSHGNLARHMKIQLSTERQTPTPNIADILQEDNVIDVDQPTTSQIRTQTAQPNITRFLRKAEKIDKQVLKMVAKGHHALRIVEEPEFKKLIEVVLQSPGYTLPTRKTLSNQILPKVYCEFLEQIKEDIRSATAVCLTTDGWTSKTNTSYMAVTAHFINQNTELKSHLIACEEFG